MRHKISFYRSNRRTCILPDAGEYTINVYASNFIGNSAEADTPVKVEARAPSTVTFKDWDGTVLETQTIRYGKAEVLKKGSDVTVLTIGNTVSKGMGIASLFDQKNVSCEVISCRFIKPFDTTTVLKSIKKTKRIVVIEDGTILGGLSTIVKELLIEYSLMNLETYFYAYPDSFIKHGSIMDLEKKYHLDEESIYRDLEKKLLKK